MNFQIANDLITEAFKKIEKVVKKNNTLPVLQGFYLEVEQDRLILIGSDNNETLRYELPVDGEQIIVNESGTIVMPYQVADIVKKIKTEMVFSLNEQNELVIKYGKKQKNEFKLNTFASEEYPKQPSFDKEQPTIRLKGTEFQAFLKKTGYAAATSETRPILQGLSLEIKEDCMQLVSTDSHRLGLIKAENKRECGLKLVIPAKILIENTKTFDFKGDVDIYCINERQVVFRNGDLSFYCRLLEGNYPDTTRLIPREFKTEMKINRKEFLEGFDLVRGISLDADNQSQGVVKLHVNGVATISSTKAQTGSGKVEVEYESLEGEDEFVIAFSSKYMMDALKAIDDDYIYFKYQGNMRPFIIAPCESSLEETHLILPVRTN